MNEAGQDWGSNFEKKEECKKLIRMGRHHRLKSIIIYRVCESFKSEITYGSSVKPISGKKVREETKKQKPKLVLGKK